MGFHREGREKIIKRGITINNYGNRYSSGG